MQLALWVYVQLPCRLLHSLSEYGVCLLTDYGTSVGSVREVGLNPNTHNYRLLFGFSFQIPQRVMYAIRPLFYGEVYYVHFPLCMQLTATSVLMEIAGLIILYADIQH